MLKAILFDLDGTLLKSETMIMEGFRHAMETVLPNLKYTKDDETNFLGQTLDTSFNSYATDEATKELLIDAYRNHTKASSEKGLVAHNNALKILKHLKANDIKVGLVTSKGSELAKANLTSINLIDYFDVIVGSDLVSNTKPNPESLRLALDLLELKVEDAIYVGDHENDIKAANSLKMLSCGVTYSYRLKEMLLENPTYVIDDLINIEDII